MTRHGSANALAARHAGAALVLAASGLLAGTLSAHGGQYRGPTVGAPPGALVPRGPGGRPAAGGMVVGGPATGGNANLDVSSWRVWWELNQDRYVREDRLAGVQDSARASMVSPSLKRALDRTQNPDVNSAAVIALGKSGVDHPEFRILDVIRARLTRGHVEVREAAVLALGISGRSDAFDDLDALVRNTSGGRKILGRDDVGDRVRTFAAYALGLLANRSDDAALKGRVLESLVTVLNDARVKDRDVLTGVLNGIRLIDPDPTKGARHKRVLWTAVAALEDYLKRRFKDQRAAVQSHALTALAALVGRGDGVEQQRAKTLVASFLGRPRLDEMVYRSATIALGEMLQPGDEEHFDVLARRVEHPPDAMVRKLGMIALGKIGGEDAYQRLSRALRGSKRDVQAWAAIGLGVLAFHAPLAPATRRQQGAGVDLRADVGKLLLSGLRKNRNKDVQAAIAIGLGLAGYQSAAPDVRKLLSKYLAIGEFSGHLCVSLALLDDTQSIPVIRGAMTTADRSVLFGHAALALARFDQLDASSNAIGVLQSGGYGPGQLRRLAAAAKAIGHLRNPRDVTILSRIVESVKGARDTDAANLRSAFAAAALGAVADRDPVGFGARIATGMNYTANLQTISNGRYGILDIF